MTSGRMLCAFLFLAACNPDEPAEESPVGATESFVDEMDTFDSGLWEKADYIAGEGRWSEYCPDHITHSDGQMLIQLDDHPCQGRLTYASGEYVTRNTYLFGRVEARMRIPAEPGTVSSLFTYTDGGDGSEGGNGTAEIDIEILGKDPTKAMFTVYPNDTPDGRGATVSLGFDASADFHTYGIEFREDRVDFFADGELVYTDDGSDGPLPTYPMRLLVDLWAAQGQEGWTDEFVYQGSPIIAAFDWISYSP